MECLLEEERRKVNEVEMVERNEIHMVEPWVHITTWYKGRYYPDKHLARAQAREFVASLRKGVVSCSAKDGVRPIA